MLDRVETEDKQAEQQITGAAKVFTSLQSTAGVQ